MVGFMHIQRLNAISKVWSFDGCLEALASRSLLHHGSFRALESRSVQTYQVRPTENNVCMFKTCVTPRNASP